MSIFNFESTSPQQTVEFASKISSQLKKGDIICLVGDLGAGKTTFTKGIAQGLRISPDKVSSPTFVLMNIYEGKLPIYHFDLYRLEGDEQIALMGYDEFFYGDGICLVEWAERLGGLIPPEYLEIQLEHVDSLKRNIKVAAKGERYQKLLEKINEITGC